MNTKPPLKPHGELVGYITVTLPPALKPSTRANTDLQRALKKLSQFTEAAKEGKLLWSMEVSHLGNHWHTTAHIIQTLQPAPIKPMTPTSAGAGKRHTKKGRK